MTETYDAFVETPSNDAFRKIVDLAGGLRTAQADVEHFERELKAAQKRVQDLVEVAIPEALDAVGQDQFMTPFGRIKLRNAVHASIAKDRLDAAVAWLDENGHGGIVKREIVVAFNREQSDEAAELLGDLSGKYPGVKQNASIHASTLKSWVTSRLEEGEPVPDSITVHVQKVADLK